MKFGIRIFTLTIVCLVLMVILPTSVQAFEAEIIPFLGYSQPLGDQGEIWAGGYNLGLEGYSPYNGIISLGCRINMNRWNVNASDLLELDNNEMMIEHNEGWRATGSATFMVKYECKMVRSNNFQPWITGGLGLHYLRNTGVYAKGFYVVGQSAVNREVRREPNAEVAAGVTLGIGFKFMERVQPSFHYQYIFSSDTDGLKVFTASLGLFAR